MHFRIRLRELAAERKRFAYRRLHVLLRREGHVVNHKKVYRLYREANLSVRRRKRQRGIAVARQPLKLPSRPNQVWTIDFVMDALANGRRLKIMTVIDDFTKEAVMIEPAHSLTGDDVTAARPRGAVPWLSAGRAHRSGTGVYVPEFRSMGLPTRCAAVANPAG